MFGKLFFIISLFALPACAHPNYQDRTAPPSIAADGNKQCELRMPVSGICVQLTWEKQPSDSEKGIFTLRFSLNESPANLANAPKVVLWMPSMGHGSAPVTVQAVSADFYRVSDVYFVMPGEWEIRIQIKDQNGAVDQVVQKITI
jgi:hypothetical protein